MTHGHAFWFLLTMLSVIWYSTITFYVTVKGYADIHRMLGELERRDERRMER